MQDFIKRIATFLLLTGSAMLAACGGSGADLPEYSLGGSVNGLLEGNSLVLQNNGGDHLSVMQSGKFLFSGGFAPGSSYAVTVMTQPAGQTCMVSNGSGALPGATSVLGAPAAPGVSNVLVNCSAGSGPFTVSGLVTGLLSGNSVVLQDNGGNSTTVAANGSFTFSAAVAAGSSYAVTILTQPPGQTCAVTNGSGGSILVDMTNVAVACSDDTFNIAATVSGLAADTSLVLQLNGADNLTVSANGTSNFSTPIADGSAYAVSILTQPAGATCAVTHGSGTVAAANVTVPVTCTVNSPPPPATFTIGGAVTGLSGSASVVLMDNGGNGTTVSGSASFTFSTVIASGSTYAVTISTQPTGYTCAVSNGSGTVASANVANVAVACSANTYTIGGTVSGLSGTVVLQDNSTSTLSITASGSFTFATVIASGASYIVTVATQPSGQTCTVSSGSGSMVAANVTSVSVTCATNVAATGGQWTWEGGSNNVNATGVYGTRGSASAGNVPGARDAAVSWTDGSGNFWLFGGAGYDSTGVNGWLNDLLMYNPSIKQWTWESGSNTVNAASVYGTQGIAAAGNVPGARYSAVSWIDSSGNFWLFGGYGGGASNTIGFLNDLWMYNPSTKQWTWESGSGVANAVGVYGTQGTAATSNAPGGRAYPVSWIDSGGNFWVFGGEGVSAGNYGDYNDLWMYNPSTKQWTWESGSDVGFAAGVYGVQGTAAAGNIPGARERAVSWTDSSGHFWLFGGYGAGVSDLFGYLNDLWMYNPSTKQWTWESGSDVGNVVGAYGTQGTAAAGNVPGGRPSAVSRIDSSGNLWLFGGNGYGSTSATGDLNDLWMYNPSTKQWTWESGSDTVDATGVYGTQGTAAGGNFPGARVTGAPWTDSSGNLWLFGGGNSDLSSSTVYFNDLWKFVP
jgi:N-acetylneuraminic acid mutarotase